MDASIVQLLSTTLVQGSFFDRRKVQLPYVPSMRSFGQGMFSNQAPKAILVLQTNRTTDQQHDRTETYWKYQYLNLVSQGDIASNLWLQIPHLFEDVFCVAWNHSETSSRSAMLSSFRGVPVAGLVTS